MFRYIDLCVELKKGRYAKDGLIHYRNVCQQVNISSLEEVIKYFMKTATDKAEAAQSKAAEAVISLDVEDLEVDATPEDLMLSYVSGEKGKDRTDREQVTPWFKFLWETYRCVLDILRNNSRLEALYAMTATRAFQFCLTYKRSTEFRRLCDILRNHLANLNKYRDQRDRPDLTNPDSLQLYLETRFEQLRVACELSLWQEAFRSVEDIQGLAALGKKAPKPQLMAMYYAKLTRIFTVSESHLYNGYAWYKLYNLAKTYNKNLTGTDVQTLAGNVLLSALAIPPFGAADLARSEAAAEQEKERSMRMANLLGFSVDAKRDMRSALSRKALLADLRAKKIVDIVPEEVRHIYTLLESEFSPLELCAQLAPLLEKLSSLDTPLSAASPVQEASLTQYKHALQQVAVLRVLRQLSEVYSVMTISSLAALIPFMGFSEVEQLVVEAVKHGYLQVRIDHKNNTVHFGALELESERLRDNISNLARRLAHALHTIHPAPTPSKADLKAKALAHALETAQVENRRAQARKVMIEKRKEDAERQAAALEQQEEQDRIMQERISAAAEEERRKQERLKREEARIAKEIEEREQEEARKMLASVQTKIGSKRLNIADGAPLDKATLMNQVISEQQRARDEAEKKVHALSRRMDHLERARREEEAPLLEAAFQKKLEADEARFHKEQEEFRVAHRKSWEVDIEEKRRFLKTLPDKEVFESIIRTRRTTEFAALQVERERRLKEKRERRMMERQLSRRQEYVRRCRLIIEERRRKEEEEKEREEAERRAREEAERLAKLEEIERKKREKEAELEEKRRKEREALLAAPRPAPTEAAPAASASGGAFVPSAKRAGGYVPPSRRGSAPAADAAPAAAPAAAAAAPSERPAAADGADKWRPGGARAAEPPAAARGPVAPPRAAEERPAARPGAFVPRHLRDRAAPPPGRDTRDEPPPARREGSRW
ncbi:g4611 [Coccomyxa elongata]